MNVFGKSLKALVVMSLFMIACKKKVEEEVLPSEDPTAPVVDTVLIVTAKTAVGFTLSWNAATDDNTAAADLLYKAVYSTVDNISNADDAEANGTTLLDWTANTLTTNVGSLTHSTNYYFAVLVKDNDGKISHESGDTTTLCTGKKMFLATVSGGDFGGKAGADAACLAQKPDGGTYKAVIADNTNINQTNGMPADISSRQACYGNCEASTLYTMDWTLATDQTYCTSDFTKKVGATTGYPVLYVSEANVMSATPVKLFTGFNIAWGNAYGSTCNDWTSTAGTFVGGTTTGTYTSQSVHELISTFPFPSCAGAGAVICAEQ